MKTGLAGDTRADGPRAFGRVWLNACLTKTRNVARGLTQRYGPPAIKQKLWDAEFSRGRWNCLDSMPDDCIYAHVERYANHGSILDLGCGPGTTGTELAADAYSHYTGVDISAVAVQKARTRAEEQHRADRNRYVQGDIFSYIPDQAYDVILFGDSLYYIPQGSIRSMLNRYSQYLTVGGVFVARIYGRRYQKILEMIEHHFDVVDTRAYPIHDDDVFVIAFRA